MFSSSLQPSVLSLFSSTSSSPLVLATTSPVGADDSLVALLSDATDTPAPSSSTPLKFPGIDVPRGNLGSRVLHLQAPDVRSTWVQWGSGSSEADALGIKLPWVVFQVKEVGQAFLLEVGVRDEKGQRAIVRASTFQTAPRAYPSSPPLLHLPLAFPPLSRTLLTPWSTVSLHLPTLIAAFPRLGAPPLSPFDSVSYVRVHANCRLRRIWCAEEGEAGEVDEAMTVRGMRTELAMFASMDDGEDAQST